MTIDPMVRQLIATGELEGRYDFPNLPVTVFFGGHIIAGEVISESEYFEHVNEQLAELLGDVEEISDWVFKDMLEELLPPNGKLKGEEGDSPSKFLHLRNTVRMRDSTSVTMNDTHLRIKASEIDAINLGMLLAIDDETIERVKQEANADPYGLDEFADQEY